MRKSNDDCGSRLEALRELARQLSMEVEAIGRTRPDLESPVDYYQEVQRFEIDLIQSALRRTRGHQAQAAKLLGIGATTLNSKIKTFGIDLPFGRGSVTETTSAGDPATGWSN